MRLNTPENLHNSVKKEFFSLTGIFPLHHTNRLEDKCVLKDIIFNSLAEKIFDQPRMLELLSRKIKHWLKVEKSEFTFFLAGCIYYLRDEYLLAERYFSLAYSENPDNIDNLFALAFSMYHQDANKQNSAKKIFFNFKELLGGRVKE